MASNNKNGWKQPLAIWYTVRIGATVRNPNPIDDVYASEYEVWIWRRMKGRKKKKNMQVVVENPTLITFNGCKNISTVCVNISDDAITDTWVH